MQTLVQLICSRGNSLRKAIADHGALAGAGLAVSEEKRQNRPHGWTKLRSTLPDRQGAINLEWDADTKILLCRVVNKGGGRPNLIVGDFVDFLLCNFKKRVRVITIIPQ